MKRSKSSSTIMASTNNSEETDSNAQQPGSAAKSVQLVQLDDQESESTNTNRLSALSAVMEAKLPSQSLVLSTQDQKKYFKIVSTTEDAKGLKAVVVCEFPCIDGEGV